MALPGPNDPRPLPARVPLKNRKVLTALDRYCFHLCWVAGLLGFLSWSGFGLVLGWWQDQPETVRYSPGPVAAVHQIWDANCQVCHEPLTPLSDHSMVRLLSATEASGRCTTCHAGPVHHGNQHPELACSTCHQEHRGLQASLVQINDTLCANCHADLKNHQKDSTPVVYKDVRQFDEDAHPEFRSRAKDPGHLKFNHQLHMKEGLGIARLTLDRLPAKNRESYRQSQPAQRDADLVQLQCSACHQPESGTARTGGATMQPIRYEQHCQACHSLSFEREAEVPHRLQPVAVRTFLEGYYAKSLMKDQLKVFETFIPARPLPGQLPEKATTEAREVLRKKVEGAERLILSEQTCLKCHELKPAEPEKAREIVATQVPTHWFQHAYFNHASHHALDCRACHQVDASARHEDVLIPGIQNCVTCHAPLTSVDGETRGGARHDCVECHRYHPAAPARAVRDRFSIENFLRGKQHPVP